MRRRDIGSTKRAQAHINEKRARDKQVRNCYCILFFAHSMVSYIIFFFLLSSSTHAHIPSRCTYILTCINFVHAFRPGAIAASTSPLSLLCIRLYCESSVQSQHSPYCFYDIYIIFFPFFISLSFCTRFVLRVVQKTFKNSIHVRCTPFP